MRSVLSDQIEDAVLAAIARKEPATNITAPLLNMLARVLVATAKTGGTSTSMLLDIATHELTEAVAHYDAHGPNPDRCDDQSGSN